MSHETLARETGADPRLTRRRGGQFWTGLTLVVSGLVLLGYVGWQFYGTTYVSKQQQQRVVEELTREWSVEPATTLEGEASDIGKVPLGRASALVRIPAFGDDYVVPVLEGVTDDALSSGFGHFRGTADPGQRGNYALAGHRITHGEPLRDMPKLRPGDQIIVETREAVHTYVLDTDPNDLVVTFDDVWVIDPLPTNPAGGVQPEQRRGQRLITLTTCAELFHTDERMIAFGHLVDTEKKERGSAG